jgi:antitoxin ParD1/3/4
MSYIFERQPMELAMNVKISIELPESHLEFLDRKVREGGYASISEVISEFLREAMWAEEDRARHDPLLAMKDEILRRLELPDDQWLSEEEFEKRFDALTSNSDHRKKAG